jgi:4-amino-4-deoxy-L-arabinose transferase-like glycosyltransferase
VTTTAATVDPAPGWRRHATAATLALVLPLLLCGIFARGLWKPDEPREAALIAHMARPGASWSVPYLGDRPFTEKPPLYYWVAATSVRLFGLSVAAVRAPNLLWALAAVLAAAALGRRLVPAASGASAARVAGVAAGVAMGTFELCWQVEIWIATDAALLATAGLAVLALWRGLNASRSGERLLWYSAMHVCLGLGVLVKNVVAWVVPVLALVVFVAWERRWRELFRWELLVGIVLQGALVAPWVLAVAARPDGAEALRSFFYYNLVGRFLPLVKTPYDYGHRVWPGHYLLGLPLYLVPWTLLLVAAARTAWRSCRRLASTAAERLERSSWRFAASLVVPAFIVLSASSTQRGIYLGPLMIGFAALLGLWAAQTTRESDGLERTMIRVTCWGMMVFALLAPATVAAARVFVLDDRGAWPWLPACLAVMVAAAALLRRDAVLLAGGLHLDALALATAAAVGAACLVVLIASPPLDRNQDLAPVARAVREQRDDRPVLLFAPDETIVATLDYYAKLAPARVADQDELAAKLRDAPQALVVTRADRRRTTGRSLDGIERRFHLSVLETVTSPYGGRSYVLLERGSQ